MIGGSGATVGGGVSPDVPRFVGGVTGVGAGATPPGGPQTGSPGRFGGRGIGGRGRAGPPALRSSTFRNPSSIGRGGSISGTGSRFSANGGRFNSEGVPTAGATPYPPAAGPPGGSGCSRVLIAASVRSRMW